MKFKIVIGCLLLLTFGTLLVARNNTKPIHEEHPARAVTVYKTPTCGCCANYVSYLQTKNYDVSVVDLSQEELTKKKHDIGVPHTLDSCHTTVAKENGHEYFVEGHIPFEAVNKLLTEYPDIKGIGMPGMPSASPGMPGTKTEAFNISQVNNDGQSAPYMTL